MSFLTKDELDALMPAEMLPHTTPIPTQIISSDEYIPPRKATSSSEVEARLLDMGDELGKKQGLSRRAFFQSAAGMAAAFVAMNDTFGAIFDVSKAEAATPAMAQERANALKDQFIMDMHTHFLRDDTRIQTFVRQREAVGKAGWNPAADRQAADHRGPEVDNYFKEVFLDSDTKIALISQRALRYPAGLVPHQRNDDCRARARQQGSRLQAHDGARHLHAGPAGLAREPRARARACKPDSIKGYTIGDNTNKDISAYPWRMDDEKVTYKVYELALKHGIKNICVHKGLFPSSIEERFPHLLSYCDVRDVGKAAKDWPQLNFIIYHSAYRYPGGGTAEQGWQEFERTGRVSWTSDLADIPAKYGVSNVYGDVGQLFAQSVVAEPRLGAALMGCWSRALAPITSAGARMRSGPDHRSGRSRRCGGSRSPKTCRRNTASPRWAGRRMRSRPRSSPATTCGSTASPNAAIWATASPP